MAMPTSMLGRQRRAWAVVTNASPSSLRATVSRYGAPGPGFDEEIDMPHQQFESCIDACYECAKACDHCASSCLQEQDVQSMTRCIGLDADCAQACRTAAGFLSRASELTSAACEMCAAVCDACAEECQRHQLQHCQECAAACRHCSEECRRALGAVQTFGRTGASASAAAH
jgi:hypothetical protein